VVQFSSEAIADLQSIKAYIARDSDMRAAQVTAMIRRKCDMLDKHKMIGRPGVEPGTRELSTAKPWVIVYELRAEGAYILRVWHSRQSRR